MARDIDKVRAALTRAGTNLDKLQSALLDRSTPVDGIAALIKTISADVGYEHYVKWMDAELKGYKGGALGVVLGAEENSSLPEMVCGYRRRNGKVLLSDRNTVPYPWFFTESIGQLEEAAAQNAKTPSLVTITIGIDRISPEGLRELLESVNVVKVPVVYNGIIYQQVLSGLRSAMVNAASELASAQKMMWDSLP